MTAWVLLVTAGVNVFTVAGIATAADCDALAVALATVTTMELSHACVSYEQASMVSEVHVVGPTAGKAPPPAPPQFKLKPQKGPSQGNK